MRGDRTLVQESMRVLPVIAIGTVRKTERAIQLGEYNIPKGLNIWVSMYAVHNNPKYWDEPEVFRPVSPITCISNELCLSFVKLSRE